MDWLLWMVLPILISEVQAINLNPFAAFADPQYEPVADYSIRRGVYLPNMPTTSIFPLMSEESLNGMVGIPSLQTPFVNPLLQQQPSLFAVPNQNDRPKASNARHPGGMIREQGNGQQNPRGVTLDIRGGGYRLDQSRSQRPYNPPAPGSNPARNAGQRNPNGRNTSPSVNRKQVQRPRGPTMNNPQRNIPSLPQNAEFVNPENVLPMHPRIYKQFLQQNPQAAAYLRSKKPGSANFAAGAPSNPFEMAKQTQAKLTRNRGLNPNSQLGILSSFQNGPNNFQIQASQKPGSQLNPQFNLQGQSLPNNPTFEDFYNSDPQFYNAFSQTPEGKAMLSQMYQHFGSSANKQNQGNPSKPPSNPVPNANPFAQTFSDINSYAAAAGYGAGGAHPAGQSANPFANSFTGSEPNNGQFNRQNLQGYSVASQYNQKPPQSAPQQQQHHQAPVQHQQALQHPSKLQQHVQPQFSPIPSNQDYSGRQPFAEAGPSPAPNHDTKKPYSQGGRNQFTPYTGQGYSEDSSSAGGAEYDPSTYQSSYQEHPKVVDGSTVDHAGYASNFSPADPVENAGHAPGSTYYGYPQGESPSFGGSSSRYPSTALHEISPSEGLKRPAESSTSFRTHPAKSVHSPGYWTPEQLFAPQATGLQSDSPLAYSSAISASSLQASQDEQQDGSERAALHLPQEASSWQSAAPKPDDASSAENSETDEGGPASTESSPPVEQDDDSEENFATVRDLQKLWTRVPQRSSSTAQRTRATTVIYRSTSPPEVVSRHKGNDELKNHRTTPSYTFQFSPSDKPGISKSTAAWWSRKAEGGSRYKIPAPTTTAATSVADVTSTPVSSTRSTPPPTTPTTTTTTTVATTITDAPPTTTTQTAEPAAFTTFYYHASSTPTISTSSEPPESTAAAAYLDATDTPACARNNNLTYCLNDPEYPKEAIREAIERNRHPLDHFLVDISASSNLVDDHPLHSVLENSAPLQSTSVSYSFEGKVISPNAGEMQNATGCDSNVHYAKPLRALNTAGLWKVIVNVEFLDTGANYTQTVRIEECTHPAGYVATCGVHSISACLQQYKLYRLLSWEAHRGFYIDAFLLPVACFCGSQES